MVDQDQWQKKAVLNTANMGWFSSDRTITEYAREIWGFGRLKSPARPMQSGGLHQNGMTLNITVEYRLNMYPLPTQRLAESAQRCTLTL